tara:strand:+ start:114 stop:326 length:213 start_codon:yes stop_codon:yes gene_type:complete
MAISGKSQPVSNATIKIHKKKIGNLIGVVMNQLSNKVISFSMAAAGKIRLTLSTNHVNIRDRKTSLIQWL